MWSAPPFPFQMAPLQLVFFACAAYIQAVACSSHHSGKQPGSNTCGIYTSKTRRWCKVDKSDFPGAVVTLQGIMKKSQHEDEMPAKLLKAYFSLYLDNSGWFLKAKWVSISKKEVSAKVFFPKHRKPKILKLEIERDDNHPRGYHLRSNLPQVVEIERFTNLEHMEIGEGPHWDEPTQSLFWVDIKGSKIFKYERRTNKIIRVTTNTKNHSVSFIIPVKGKRDHFVIGEKLSLVLIHWDTGANKIRSRKVLVKLHEPKTHRLNDGKCDAQGRIWFGTMSDGRPLKQIGSFYSFSPEEGLKTHMKGNIWVSNGIATSADNKKFWYIDSLKYTVDEYDFDMEQAELRFVKEVINITKLEGMPEGALPDGMTIDTDDKLWVAVHGGRQVLKVDPTSGAVLMSVRFPLAHQQTSVSFGGPNFDELYVTTADEFNDAATKEKFPESGSLYRVTGLGVHGRRGYDFVS